MSKRRNTSTGTKAALSRLRAKGLMWNTKLGFRHVITPDGSIVRHEELDLLPGRYDCFNLPNWHPGAEKCTVRTVYDGKYARLVATYGSTGWFNTPCDVSSHFPINFFATDLINLPGVHWHTKKPSTRVYCYGDAVVCTDISTRWIFNYWQRDLDEDEVCFVDENLTTRRRLLRESIDGRSAIYFYETPNEIDLVYLVMRFA